MIFLPYRIFYPPWLKKKKKNQLWVLILWFALTAIIIDFINLLLHIPADQNQESCIAMLVSDCLSSARLSYSVDIMQPNFLKKEYFVFFL